MFFKNKKCRSGKIQDNFSILASQQLRSPLATIRWYDELLLENKRIDTKTQKKYLLKIEQAAKRMAEIIENLLIISNIQLGKYVFKMEDFSINKLVVSVLNNWKFETKEKKIKFEFKKEFINGLEVMLDKKLVYIILDTLLHNAIKYTPEKGKVSLQVKKEDGLIKIIVSDTGYGMPQHGQAKIFGKIFGADNTKDSDLGSVGLGLYITKQIVEKCDGRIWFESLKNKGTRFFVELPLVEQN
ncbi:MAG: HAMP domain-containing sensor histidine kinase [Candidatus Magasanikbacteria bacterium]